MGQLQPLHQVSVGRSREVRGPDGMEMGIAVVIVAIVISMATWFGMRLIPMVQTLDAVSLASGPACNEIIYHAVHGRWPPSGDPTMIAGNNKGLFVNQLALGVDGVITARLTIGAAQAIRAGPSAAGTNSIRGSLSFRPELLGSRDAPTITFICGYAQPVVGSAATSRTNLTTLDVQVLPPFCR